MKNMAKHLRPSNFSVLSSHFRLRSSAACCSQPAVPIQRWQERFDEFVARKQNEAARAVASALRHRGRPCGSGNARNRQRMVEGSVRRRLLPLVSCRSNASGMQPRLRAIEGREHGREKPLDPGRRRNRQAPDLRGLSRTAADAVLAGAETIRGGALILSVWHPELVRLRESIGKPRHPVQVVATLQGLDLEHGLLFNTPAIRVVLITVGSRARLMDEQVATRPWITPVVMGTPEDLPDAFETAARAVVTQVSAIGGRRIATQLIDAGLVQDVYLTTSPRPGGEPDTPMYPETAQRRRDGQEAGNRR